MQDLPLDASHPAVQIAQELGPAPLTDWEDTFSELEKMVANQRHVGPDLWRPDVIAAGLVGTMEGIVAVAKAHGHPLSLTWSTPPAGADAAAALQARLEGEGLLPLAPRAPPRPPHPILHQQLRQH